MINSLNDLKFSKNAAKFFRKARAGREFPSPSTPFLPAPPERFGILRNAAGVSLKKGSRIFNYSPPIQNEAAFSKPEGGTREARPTDFPPIFPNEFGASPSATRTVFSARSRCEPKISLATTFLLKRLLSRAIVRFH